MDVPVVCAGRQPRTKSKTPFGCTNGLQRGLRSAFLLSTSCHFVVSLFVLVRDTSETHRTEHKHRAITLVLGGQNHKAKRRLDVLIGVREAGVCF